MATVQHGRRKGSPKDLEQDGGKSKEKFIILSSNEWGAIKDRKNKVLPKDVQLALDLKKDKEEKAAKSKEQVGEWGNTIVGKRNKRLNARKIREDQEETERVKLDIEEAKIKAAERRAAIEHAKKLQYYQTDRVKGFHGALLLSEVIVEREAQIALKEDISKAMKNADEQFLQWEESKRQEAIKLDQDKAVQRNLDTGVLRATQYQQAQERRKEQIAEKVQDLEEGKLIQKDVEQYYKETEVKQKEREVKQVKLKESYDTHLELVERIKEQERISEKQADEEIRLYATAKRKMTTLRKNRECELFLEFQNHQNKMVDHLATMIKEKVDDEDSRIKKAVAERDAKRQIEEEQGRQKRGIAQQEILQHRLQKMDLQDNKKVELTMEQELDLKRRISEDEAYFNEQAGRSVNRKGEAVEIQGILQGQQSEKSKIKAVNLHNELEADKRSGQMVKEEEDEFQRYADAVIDMAKQRGRPTGPLIKAKNAGAGGGSGPIFEGKSNLRPSYQSMDAMGVQLPRFASGAAGQKIASHKTDKRLGFVW